MSGHQHDPWRRDRLVIDTSVLTAAEAVRTIVVAAR